MSGLWTWGTEGGESLASSKPHRLGLELDLSLELGPCPSMEFRSIPLSNQIITLEVEKKAQKSEQAKERPNKDDVVVISGSITVSF